MFLSPDNFIYEDEDIVIDAGTNMVHSDICMNYFLSDGSVLETVRQGEFYMTESKADALGVDMGDKLTIELNGVSREFVLADKIKDALFGSNHITPISRNSSESVKEMVKRKTTNAITINRILTTSRTPTVRQVNASAKRVL
mgnify:CR=1 FL=1